MPPPFGVLHMRAAVTMPADRDKQRVILLQRRAAADPRELRDAHGVRSDRSAVVHLDGCLGRQQDQRRRLAHAQRAAVAVRCPECDAERAIRARVRNHHRRIQREAHAARRERDARGDGDPRSGHVDLESPADAAEAKAAPHVEQAFAQPVLQVLQMVRGDSEPIHEMRARVVGHGPLGRVRRGVSCA
jgi:hypothetical protein